MTNVSGDKQQILWLFHKHPTACVCYTVCLPNTT